jgi:hypothetical protein
MFEKIYRILVLILLVVMILGEGVIGYFAYTENQENKARAELCNQSVESADFTGLWADYEAAVYNNPDVDNINKQTFMANEYLLLALSKQTMILANCLP